jgi:HD-GYP domain-containing protein (c-di-GMP phosphodiesterase class II)
MSRLPSEFLPFRVSTLRGDQPIPFNAYVRVNNKFILFCREGDSFEGERLNRLRQKKLSRMYLLKEEAPQYDSYLKENTRRAYDSSAGAPFDVRVQIIQGALQAATEDLLDEPDSEAFVRVVDDAIKRFLGFLYDHPESLLALLNISNDDANIAQHSVSVAALATELARVMGFDETRPLEIPVLGLAASIHDLEHQHMPVTLTVPVEDLSQNELRIYKSHCKNGFARIKDLHFYPPLAKDIVRFHHEHIDGSGLEKKKEKDLDPFVFIVATADCFDQLLVRHKLTPKDAFKKMTIEQMGVVPLDCIRALQTLLKKSNLLV